MKKWVFGIVSSIAVAVGLWTTVPQAHAGENFSTVINETVNTNREFNLFERLQKTTFETDAEGLRDFIAWVAFKIILPVMIWVGIIISIIGFYKLMTYDTQEDLNKAEDYILRGIIGVIVMVSAGYIADQLVGTTGEGGIVGEVINNGASGGLIAEAIYVNIFFPFIRIFIYIAMGVLFLLVLSFGIKYIFTSDENIQKKAMTVLLYNAMGIFVIILAKTMVEAIYGPYAEVVKASITNLGEVGVILDDPGAQFGAVGGLYGVINWVLGIVTFIVVIIIIYQGYNLMVNQGDEDAVKKMKRNLIYIFIGIIIIGTGYLLTNFFIVV